MHPSRFDVLTIALGDRRSRRSALKGTAVLAAAALGASTIRRAAAQDSTPASAEMLTDDAFLFVQTAASGTFVPNPGAGTPAVDGTPTSGGGADYLLTLEGHPGGTVYFSDRPARIFGEAPTQGFLDGLGFGPGNPPNAALVAETDAGDGVVVLELVDPAYDADAATLTYGANILAEYEGEGLAHVADQSADAELPDSFGRASLFIDDCPDAYWCANASLTVVNGLKVVGPIPGGPYGMCWSWPNVSCVPCRDYGDLAGLCNRTYPNACTESCQPIA